MTIEATLAQQILPLLIFPLLALMTGVLAELVDPDSLEVYLGSRALFASTTGALTAALLAWILVS